MNVGPLLGQLRVIPLECVSGVEDNIHRFEVIGVGMVVLHVFPICRQHQRSIPALFLAKIAVIHDDGLASGWSGASILQNCPFAH